MTSGASPRVPGRLVLRGVRCTSEGQLLLVDLIALCDLGPPARSDDMADAVDIAEMATIVRDLAAERPRVLLESLVVDCARALLERLPAIESIEVRIARPDPPGLNAAEEIVEVTLSR